MLVKLRYQWFGPSEKVIGVLRGTDRIRSISGKRWRAGVHEMPDHLQPYLPSSAKILDKKEDEVKVERNVTLKDFDTDLMAAVEVDNKVEAARQRMEHARAAKGK